MFYDAASLQVMTACLRRNRANPEDWEYYECQQEMMEDLYKQYCQVERVISKWFYYACHSLLFELVTSIYFQIMAVLFAEFQNNGGNKKECKID